MTPWMPPSYTSVHFYQTTRRHIPRNSYLYSLCLENLKSHLAHRWLCTECETRSSWNWLIIEQVFRGSSCIKKLPAHISKPVTSQTILLIITVIFIIIQVHSLICRQHISATNSNVLPFSLWIASKITVTYKSFVVSCRSTCVNPVTKRMDLTSLVSAS